MRAVGISVEFEEISGIEFSVGFTLHINELLLTTEVNFEAAGIQGGEVERGGEHCRIYPVNRFTMDGELEIPEAVVNPLVTVFLSRGL